MRQGVLSPPFIQHSPFSILWPCICIIVQPIWNISFVRPRWRVGHPQLPTTWISSPRGAWRWESTLWTLLSCFDESECEVWRYRLEVRFRWLKLLKRKNLYSTMELGKSFTHSPTPTDCSVNFVIYKSSWVTSIVGRPQALAMTPLLCRDLTAWRLLFVERIA